MLAEVNMLIGIVLLVVAITDWYWRRISNVSVLCLLGLVLTARYLAPDPQWLNAVSLALAFMLVGFLCWQKQWLGAGDVKLIAVSVLAVFPDWQPFVFACAFGAGAFGVCLLVKQSFFPLPDKPSLPLGVVISASCGYFFLFGT